MCSVVNTGLSQRLKTMDEPGALTETFSLIQTQFKFCSVTSVVPHLSRSLRSKTRDRRKTKKSRDAIVIITVGRETKLSQIFLQNVLQKCILLTIFFLLRLENAYFIMKILKI